MKHSCLYAVVLLLCMACNQKKAEIKKIVVDPCINGKDTVYVIDFTKDTSTNDFYGLLDFIESKGAFSRFTRENKIDSSSYDTILLKKILCQEKYFDSPLERCVLRNLHCMSWYFTAITPKEDDKKIYPGFRLTQMNFVNAKEQEIAFAKINEIRWGEPFVISNFSFVVSGNKRLYVLETYMPGEIERMRAYSEMIKRDWVKR